MSIDLGASSTINTLYNPDNSKAYYEGNQFLLKLNFPLSDRTSFFEYGFNIHTLQGNLDNTSNQSGINESAKLNAYGSGLEFKFGPILVSYDVRLLNGKHIGAGNGVSGEFEYSVITHGYSVGYIKSSNDFGIGVAYTSMTGRLSSSDTGFSNDSDFDSQSIWLIFRINTGWTSKGLYSASL